MRSGPKIGVISIGRLSSGGGGTLGVIPSTASTAYEEAPPLRAGPRGWLDSKLEGRWDHAFVLVEGLQVSSKLCVLKAEVIVLLIDVGDPLLELHVGFVDTRMDDGLCRKCVGVGS